MAKPNVLISIETKIQTEAKAFGRNFMRCLIDQDPRLIPELVSTSERFKSPFVDLDHFIEEWWAIFVTGYLDNQVNSERFWGPHWKRKSVIASRGYVTHGFVDRIGWRFPSKIWFQARWNKRVEFEHIFLQWVKLTKPSVAMIHVFTDTENNLFKGEDYSWFQTGSFGGRAKPGIANIGWAMAYGEEYASEINIERVAAAGFPVSMLEGVIVVQVTEKLSDVVEDFDHFSRRRAELKRLFRSDLFWIRGEPGAML